MNATSTRTRRGRTLSVVVCLGALGFAVHIAYAHFNLMAPTNWLVQNGSGDPQKQAPCGNEGPMTASNAVGNYNVGDMVTITVKETVFHPGHYRVSLAPTQASLPPDPDVTPDSTSDCGSIQIMANPQLPLIADDLFDHTGPFSGPQTMSVRLPPGITCDHCVLQVQEFMSDHGKPCFYHHCAIINITGAGTPLPTPPDAGASQDGGTGSSGGPPESSNGCSAGGGSLAMIGPLLVAGLVMRRRRSARRSAA